MSRAIQCIACNVWLLPFGETDIAELVLEHLRNVHTRTAPIHPCEVYELHSSMLTPEPVA